MYIDTDRNGYIDINHTARGMDIVLGGIYVSEANIYVN